MLSTLAVIGLGVGGFFFGKQVRRAWRRRSRERGEDWWRFWRGWSEYRLRLVDVVQRRRSEEEVEEEQRPLLDAEG